MAEYQVVEKFVSINGEGTKAGQLAVFIRFRGCNLNCSFCDTSWANEENASFQWMTADEIFTYIQETGVKNVTLTGGEPLLQKELKVLIETLSKDSSLSVEIETNGSIPIEKHRITDTYPVFTMDYKLPGSNMEHKMCLQNMSQLKPTDTVKFVVGCRKDLERANELICTYDLVHKCHVYLSPVFGKIKPKDIVDFMVEKQLNGVNLQLQMHKYIWNPETRGV